jgi:hypothetical protein
VAESASPDASASDVQSVTFDRKPVSSSEAIDQSSQATARAVGRG